MILRGHRLDYMKKIIALAFLAATLFNASPAIAHDEVETTYPEAGSTVEAGAIDLNITFGEPVMITDGNTGLDIAVSNAKGDSLEVGCLNPVGNSLEARTLIAEPGEYKVSWRSVSTDGHPTEGEYSFTVINTQGYEVNKDDLLACPRMLIATPIAEDINTTSPVANDNTATELAVLGAVVIVLVGATVWITKKRKR